MDPKLLSTVAVGVLMAWAIYRRLTRTLGRQRVSAPRLWIRAGILCALGIVMLLTLGNSVELLGSLLLGVACGIALGMLGLRHTQFENTAEGRFYTPHTYIGLIVSALLLGRVIYRLAPLYAAGQSAYAMDQNPYAVLQKSPLTVAIFGVLIGYYVLFNLGVWSRSRQLV